MLNIVLQHFIYNLNQTKKHILIITIKFKYFCISVVRSHIFI